MTGTSQRTRTRWLLLLAALLALSTVLSACGGGSEGEDTDSTAAEETKDEESTPSTDESEDPDDADDSDAAEGAGEVLVTADEYSFDLPATLPAGEVEFSLKNVGEQPHHLIMAKLTEDAPPIEKLVKMKDPEKFLDEDLTGRKPPFAKPGKSSDDTIEATLTPGTYAYACFIGDKKKKVPHAFLGMTGTFEVQ